MKILKYVNANAIFIQARCIVFICSSLSLLQPLKWELKQQPGMSPPRGGFNADDPNQQIVADDIFDEYGGESFMPCIKFTALVFSHFLRM